MQVTRADPCIDSVLCSKMRPVAKTWAYLNAEGSDWISAEAVQRERDENYGGKPLGITYFSTHQPPDRKPVKHVRHQNGQCYFSFINDGDEERGGGPGESLQHRLFKQALAGVRKTRLCLDKYGAHDVRVTHHELEKEVTQAPTLEDRLYVDTFWVFETVDDTGIDARWDGKLCLEVCHEHPVPADKIDRLRDLRVPSVEVEIPDQLLYEYDEVETSDALERRYVERMIRMFESERGYVSAKVLSDPETIEDLEDTVRELSRDKERLTSEAAMKSARVLELEKQLEDARWAAGVAGVAKELEQRERTGERDYLQAQISSLTRQATRLRIYCALAFAAGLGLYHLVLRAIEGLSNT